MSGSGRGRRPPVYGRGCRMAWFSKKQPVAVAEPELSPKKVVTGPRLAILTPDIAGISTFRLSLQDDATDAEQMVARLPSDVRRGTHAFWAMHERPAVDESLHVEALVLIRVRSTSELLYVVSFLDLESALSFTRFEMRRGLYIGNVMIYWAAFSQIREELEGVTILPSVAPIADKWLGPDPRLAPPLPEPQASVAIAEPVAAPEPAIESIAESEARQAVERYLEENPEKAVEDSVAVIERPVIEALPVIDDEPVSEEAAVADALVLQHPPVAEPVVHIEPAPVAEIAQPEPDVIARRRPTPWTLKRKWADREARRRAAAQQQLEVVAKAQPEVVAEEPLIVAEESLIVAEEPQVIAAEPSAQEPESLQVIAERIATYAGDEETESEQTIEIEAKGPSIDPANGLPQNEKYSEFDIALEVERLLKNRKWETREGPFRGFKSPPGKF